MTKKFEIIYSKIVENFSHELAYGYWISRDGEVIKVGYQNHGGMALRIISKNAKYDSEFSPNVSAFTDTSAKIIMAIKFLLNIGWVKVQADMTNKTLYFSKIKSLSSKQRDVLEELSIDFNLELEEDPRWNK
ncbi:MAG TPA: hypothetical protein PKU78_06580 [Candidatus Dojkabacteria bacterium]|nr:hypothetical protein [Candidatus Dojkabacteria bacterium]